MWFNEDILLLQEGASFADESYKSGDWFKPVVLAQISKYDELIWFFKLRNNFSQELSLSKLNKGKKGKSDEIKAFDYYYLFCGLSTAKKREIWHTLKNVTIIIEDPKQYFAKMGITPITRIPKRFEKQNLLKNKSDFIFKHKEKQILINEQNPMFSFIKKFIITHIYNEMISSSPLHRINSDLGFIGDYFFIPEKSFTTPSELIEKVSDKSDDVFAKIEKLTLPLARVRSAFLNFPTLYSIFNESEYRKLNSYEIYHVYESRLEHAMRSKQIFDEGNEPSINLIKNSFLYLDSKLNHYKKPEWEPLIEEQQSSSTPEIQAADFAAYFARNIYEKWGIKEVCKYFNTVYFNGKPVGQNSR